MAPMKSITSGAPSARAKRSTFLMLDEKQPSEDVRIRMNGRKNDSKTQCIIVGLTNINLTANILRMECAKNTDSLFS